jgi:uncharacterized protein (TIGR00369 family)
VSMNAIENLKPLRNRRDHHCFACGPGNPHGLQMTFFTDERTVFSWLRVPEHLRGWDNLVHGGVISAVLDEIMSWAAIYLIKKITLTKSMTVEFLKPVTVGSQLRAEGRLLELVGAHEARFEGVVYNAKEACCARSQGLFVMLEPRIAKRLGVLGEGAVREFEHIINL